MKDIEKKLRTEIKNSVLLPDLKERIRGKIDFRAKSDESEIVAESSDTALLKTKKVKIIVAAALIIAVLAAALSIGIYYYTANNNRILPPPAIAGNVYVRISINPSVEFEIDGDNKVIAQKGLNKDGVTLLYKKSFIGLTATEASAAVISGARLYGYLDNAENIRLNVVSNDDDKAAKLSEAIIANIASEVPDKKIVTPRDDAEIVKEAEKKGVSAEKWQIIKIAVNHGYSEGELINQSIDDIIDLIEDTDELEEYAKEIAGDIEKYMTDVIDNANSLIALLEPMLDEGVEDDRLPNKAINAIKEYAEYFDKELAEDINEYRIGDIPDIIEELQDTIDEFRELIEEFKEDGDEISDVLEDCLDGYKKWQNKNKNNPK